MSFNFKIWIRFAIFNLLIVGLLGLLMRYKIGFEFPFFNQKNLQHAHSHFAFSGWISMMLMVLMLHSVREKLTLANIKSYRYLFIASLTVSYGMLISFATQGYAFFSITFSTLSVIISFWFCYKFFNDTKNIKSLPGVKWMNIAMLYNILSTFGTISLSYMMATKQVEQHSYLASVYWYLHFQYNGWFFFACVGLFLNYLYANNITVKNENRVYIIFSLACLPAYGLSILWLDLPMWLYILIILAAVGQCYALFIFIKQLIADNNLAKIKLDVVAKLLLLCAAVAISTKILLQAGSTVPELSKLAFGFRPIVIAYLHLVLLAFTSVFLISFAYLNQLIVATKKLKIGLIIFAVGVVLNEVVLAIQGILSISYTMFPLANLLLFIISLIIVIGIALINFSELQKRNSNLF